CGNHAFLVLSFVLAVPAPTAIYPLSLHDALPISCRARWTGGCRGPLDRCPAYPAVAATTRLERTSPASSPRLRMHGQASSSRSLRWLSVAGAQRQRGGRPPRRRGSRRGLAPSRMPWPTPPVTESATECGSPCC